jgi:F-type H+-transporting ATPase subunit delta
MPAPRSNNSQAEFVDPRVAQAAGVYAKAFLGAAEKSGQAAALIEELESLVRDVLDRFPAWEQVLASSLVKEDEKVAMLDRTLAGRASPTLLNFLKVLARRERLAALRSIARSARALYEELHGRVPVEVRTARPLGAEQQTQLAAALKRLVGREPQMTVETDAGLLGGVVLRVGDTVYDASVSTRLERLRAQMIHRSVHEIQSRRDRFRHPGGN